MCLFSSPKAPPPPPPPPTPESRQEEELRQRKRHALRQGPFISPYALAQTGFQNPTPQKTLLGA